MEVVTPIKCLNFSTESVVFYAFWPLPLDVGEGMMRYPMINDPQNLMHNLTTNHW